MGYGLLGIVIIVLCVKIYLMKKSAREISAAFTEKLQADTNTLISISSHDKDIAALAENLNDQLRIFRKAQLQYQQGNAELKTAVTNISHDLRTPLTAICGYLDLIQNTDDPAKISRYLSVIAERTESMKQLTEELFRYSVIIADESELPKEPVFVNQLLAECIADFYPALADKGIVPQIQMSDQRIMRNVNRNDLARIFSNLLNNAVRYSDGDLSITLTDSGEIIFANTAACLSSIKAEQLFDRFYTVETARNSTGLGLSIAKTLIERMDGTIAAQYSDGQLVIRIELQ